MFGDIRAFVSLDADPPTYMGFGIPMPPPEYQVLLHYQLSTLLSCPVKPPEWCGTQRVRELEVENNGLG